jgi:hypothetical protein
MRPLMAAAMCLSTSMIFTTLLGSSSGDVSRFSTAKITPSLVWMPTAVEPSLMASMAYSTWKRRPSGEKVLTPRSYSLLWCQGARVKQEKGLSICICRSSAATVFAASTMCSVLQLALLHDDK